MASLISSCIKSSASDDYCVDLRSTSSHLIGCFNSSNSIHTFSLPSLQLSQVIPTNTTGVLSEIAIFNENSVFWADRQGKIGLIDFRTGNIVHEFSISEEIFSIDCSDTNLATASDKQIKVFDIRNFQEKRNYTELYADDNDITCVRMSPRQGNVMLSCSEDSLMALCNVDSIEEDDYTLLNVDEPALKVGFCENDIFCVTINRLVSYNPYFDDPDRPPEVLFRHRLFELQTQNPELGYFISEHIGSERVLLGGSHEGDLYAYNSQNTRNYYVGKGHQGTIRCSVMIQGIIITGGEDSAILAWSLQDQPVQEEHKKVIVPSKIKREKEDRYFKPY
ncbi:hypothetical protein SteCoe_7298 [Stentor coeruleus]|uniref:Anaphase-promoting complex subunit 4 WD40 domain-containing protein n=1 Tax=Stentor coeruleus TaxID=5963 RepID=A0A1R2CMY8_9CILI|nr:hypothetical protein SteCoe_7298 [Stentor coeruleus]